MFGDEVNKIYICMFQKKLTKLINNYNCYIANEQIPVLEFKFNF